MRGPLLIYWVPGKVKKSLHLASCKHRANRGRLLFAAWVLSVSFGTSLDGIPCQKVAVAPALNTSVDPDHGHGCTSLQSLTRATFVFWGFIKINRIRMTENKGKYHLYSVIQQVLVFQCFSGLLWVADCSQ